MAMLVWAFAAGAFVGSLATYLHMKLWMKGALQWAGEQYIRVCEERDTARDAYQREKDAAAKQGRGK